MVVMMIQISSPHHKLRSNISKNRYKSLYNMSEALDFDLSIFSGFRNDDDDDVDVVTYICVRKALRQDGCDDEDPNFFTLQILH